MVLAFSLALFPLPAIGQPYTESEAAGSGVEGVDDGNEAEGVPLVQELPKADGDSPSELEPESQDDPRDPLDDSEVSSLVDNDTAEVDSASLQQNASEEIFDESETPDAAQATLEEGVYLVQLAFAPSYVLQVAGGSSSAGANIELHASDMSLSQRFEVSIEEGSGFYRFVNIGSGKVLDIAGSPLASGSNVEQNEPSDSLSQRWVVSGNDDGTFTIASAFDESLVLDVWGATARNGANVQAYSSNGTNAQKFRFVSISPVVEGGQTVEDGIFTISSAADPERVVDVSSCSFADGANIQLWQANGTAAQMFKLTYDGAGFYSVICLKTLKALDVEQGNLVPGTNVRQWSYDASKDSQKWAVRDEGGGTYVFISKANGLALSADGGGVSSGSNIQTDVLSDAASQRFALNSARGEKTLEEGEYVIASACGSGFVLDVESASVQNGANVQIYSTNMTDAQKFLVSFDPFTGFYTIANKKSGKVLDVESGSAASGVNVSQYESNETLAQKWRIIDRGDGTYAIVSALASSLALDVYGASGKNGTNVEIYNRNDTAAQKFTFFSTSPSVQGSKTIDDGVYRIKSVINPSKVVDIEAGSERNGANAQLYEANGSPAQSFLVAYDGDGFYHVRCFGTGKALDVDNGGLLPGTNVLQWSYAAGKQNQKWAIEDNGDGSFTLFSKANALVLDIPSASAVNGANVQVYFPNGSDAQKFIFEPIDAIEEGVYTISSCVDSGKVVDIDAASSDDGANVQMYESNDSFAQKMQFESAGDGAYAIRPLCSGLYLSVEGGNVVQKAGAGPDGEPGDHQLWMPVMGSSGVRFLSKATGLALGGTKGLAIGNGTNIGVFEDAGSLHQEFFLYSTVVVSSGTYLVQSALPSNKVLDVDGGSCANGANVQLYDKNNSGAQKWVLSQAANGYVMLRNAKSKKALDVYGCGTEPGTNVQQWKADGNKAQLFKPVPSGDGCFYLESACGGQYLDIKSADDRNGANVNVYTPNRTLAQKFRFVLTSYSYTTDDLRDTVDSASGAWGITSFGGYSPSASVRSSLQSAVNVVRGGGYDAGFLMVDLETGQGVACNADRKFYSASTVKGPYVASLACCYPQSVIGWGSTMETTIRVSSNEGYASLRSAFGSSPMRSWCNDAGVRSSLTSDWYVDYSARELLKLWIRNYEYFTSGQEYSTRVRSWFVRPLASVIGQQLGSSYTTYSKPGWISEGGRYDVANDAGIVMAGNRPYFVAIMTNTPAQFYKLNSIVWALEEAHNEMVYS